MAGNTLTNFSSVPVATNERGYYTPEADYGKVINLNTTDVVYQDVKVFIEGVEVPFSTVMVNQAMWQMPTCTVEVPPHPGLLEICKYYHPKLHIFFQDLETGDWRVLFWGNITSSMYTKNVNVGGGSSISFRGVHRNQILKQFLLYFGNFTTNESQTANNPPGTLPMETLNSEQAVIQALTGITGIASGKDLLSPSNADIKEADVNKLDSALAEFEQRLIGIPSIIVCLWNIVKKAALGNVKTSLTTLTLYLPLFEEGISYFKRMSGHYYLEKQQDDSRGKYCNDKGVDRDLLLGPTFRTGFMDAFQAQLTVQSVQAGLGFSGELSSFIDVCERFMQALHYEIVTLASPAEVPLQPGSGSAYDSQDKLVAIDTVIKPVIPFYYAPVCNVLLPRMITSVDIAQDDMAVPSRNYYYNNSIPGSQTKLMTNFEGPNTVREAISIAMNIGGNKDFGKYDLRATTGTDPNIPGMFEQGRGVLPRRVNPPWWLTQMMADQSTVGDSGSYPKEGTPEYDQLILIARAWEDRTGYNIVYDTKAGTDSSAAKKVRNTDKDTLNPFSLKVDPPIPAWERLMFAAVDYEFSELVSQSRQGSVTGVFNPYIVVGYPMDVLDDSPSNPSFHALCTSITHTITSRGMNTTVGMACVTTYGELTNYYNPPLPPWLQIALGVVNADENKLIDPSAPKQYGDTSVLGKVRSTIVQNPDARQKADEFYSSVFGVGAADPSEMMDFGTGQIIPQGRDAANGTLYANAQGRQSLAAQNGGQLNDWNTTMGNLRLIKRPIETQASIESKMSETGYPYKFIDMSVANYSGSMVEYSNPYLAEEFLVEPGASLFLDYTETVDFVKPAAAFIKK